MSAELWQPAFIKSDEASGGNPVGLALPLAFQGVFIREGHRLSPVLRRVRLR